MTNASLCAVIDTNVLVSALWSKNPLAPPLRIVRAIAQNDIVTVHSPEIVAEYREVLFRGGFDFSPGEVEALVGHIERFGIAVTPVESDAVFPDPDDRVFYCTARTVDGAWLVTGNARHFPRADFVVSPARFCEIAGL